MDGVSPQMQLLLDQQSRALDVAIGAAEALDKKLVTFLGSGAALSAVGAVLSGALPVASQTGTRIVAALLGVILILQVVITAKCLRAWWPRPFPIPRLEREADAKLKIIDADATSAALTCAAILSRSVDSVNALAIEKAGVVFQAGIAFLCQLLIASLIVTLRLLALAGL